MEQYIAKVTEIMREADQLFQTTGGSTRHYVRDLLLPMFEQAGLKIVDAEPSPAKAEQEGPWVKASDRLPEIADGVTKLKIDGKEAEGVWSATEQAFIVGGHRYPPTLYYIEWLDEKKRREQEGLRLPEDIAYFLRDIATNFDHDYDAHKYNTRCRMCEAQKLRDKYESNPPVKEAGQPAGEIDIAKYTLWVFTEVVGWDKADHTFRLHGEIEHRPISDLYPKYLESQNNKP